MAFENIRNIPLDQWTETDLQKICDDQIEEGRFLEFKEDMADGDKGWRTSKGSRRELSRKEKESICKEVVAFANSYGGHLIIGISEDKRSQASGLSKPLPDITDLVSHLRNYFADVIDPPLRNLAVQPILSASSETDGYVVIHVPVSLSAPHGFGRPSKCYIRNGERSEPMSMRDIQNVFWESRTRRERIDAEFERQSRIYKEFCSKYDTKLLFRFTIILEHAIELTGLFNDIASGAFFEVGTGNNLRQNLSGQLPSLAKWRPDPKGARGIYPGQGYPTYEPPGYWEMDETGVVSVIGVQEAQGSPLFLTELCSEAGTLIALGMLMAVKAGTPGVDLLFDGEFWCREKVCVPSKAGLEQLGQHGSLSLNQTEEYLFDRPAHIRPLRLKSDDVDGSCNLVEEKIWNCFGCKAPGNSDFVSRCAGPVHHAITRTI